MKKFRNTFSTIRHVLKHERGSLFIGLMLNATLSNVLILLIILQFRGWINFSGYIFGFSMIAIVLVIWVLMNIGMAFSLSQSYFEPNYTAKKEKLEVKKKFEYEVKDNDKTSQPVMTAQDSSSAFHIKSSGSERINKVGHSFL